MAIGISTNEDSPMFMLCHGFDELVEDETLIVQLGRLAQLGILSDELDLARDLADSKESKLVLGFQ